MKKLMIAAAIVCAAAFAQAAEFNWKMTSYQYYYDGYKTAGQGTQNKLASGTAYLFVAAASDLSEGFSAYTQSQLVSDFQGGMSLEEIQKKSIANTTISSGATAAKTFNYAGVAADKSLYAYAAIFVTENGENYVYISNVGNQMAQAASTPSLTIGASATSTSKATFSTDPYSAAGWYAVPEPTSGLLLLVGLGALALRRRRA